ncbi:MAG: hypothetical protein ACN4GZ_02300 [Acidimicrobiales bacterium]
MIQRLSITGSVPPDPVGIAVAEFVGELLSLATIKLHYRPIGWEPTPEEEPDGSSEPVAAESRQILDGWITTLIVDFEDRIPVSIAQAQSELGQTLDSLPAAALNAAVRFQAVNSGPNDASLSPSLLRALRDTIIVEFLAQHPIWNGDDSDHHRLLAETIEYLIELSGTKVESQDLTHGVVITNALTEQPRLTVRYPSGLRPAKRSPLLFDGRQAVLVVDEMGRARTELQAHRLDQLIPDAPDLTPERKPFSDSGSLVAHATEKLGGIGFYLQADRSIWAFVDGRPLVVRRSEHWKAFPIWLTQALQETVGQGSAVELVVQAALIVSMQEKGAIFGIVGSTDALDTAVALKDRYDLRDDLDPNAMQPETRLHHLIETTVMDAQTLARLAGLDGATIVDCHGNLLAYGAILTSRDSQHEGARTAAAKTLSLIAMTVLMVSQDGEITVFQDGRVVTTLL